MTVTYTLKVANVRFGGFSRLLLYWKGSIYQLLYKEMLFYAACYAALSFLYRLALNGHSKEMFENISMYCENFTDLIPLSFVLGFYVSIVVTRWWQQYVNIPWPDRLAMYITAYVLGSDEQSIMIRRTMIRYANLTSLLVFQSISMRVKKRFPTMEHVVEAGFMTENERKLMEELYCPHGKWWFPIMWLNNLISKSRQDGRITSDYNMNRILEELHVYRGCCGMLYSYDWISVPLVYTQVVTLATYIYFLASLMGKQYLNPESGNARHAVDLYIPFFTFLQFFFYMGWLKVAEQLINPFGEDEDDFDMNWIIDRNMQVGYLSVDDMHQLVPPLERDIHADDVECVLPYTSKTVGSKKKPHMGSVFNLGIKVDDMSMVVPMETIKEQGVACQVGSRENMHADYHKSPFLRLRNISSSITDNLDRLKGNDGNKIITQQSWHDYRSHLTESIQNLTPKTDAPASPVVSHKSGLRADLTPVFSRRRSLSIQERRLHQYLHPDDENRLHSLKIERFRQSSLCTPESKDNTDVTVHANADNETAVGDCSVAFAGGSANLQIGPRSAAAQQIVNIKYPDSDQIDDCSEGQQAVLEQKWEEGNQSMDWQGPPLQTDEQPLLEQSSGDCALLLASDSASPLTSTETHCLLQSGTDSQVENSTTTDAAALDNLAQWQTSQESPPKHVTWEETIQAIPSEENWQQDSDSTATTTWVQSTPAVENCTYHTGTQEIKQPWPQTVPEPEKQWQPTLTLNNPQPVQPRDIPENLANVQGNLTNGSEAVTLNPDGSWQWQKAVPSWQVKQETASTVEPTWQISHPPTLPVEAANNWHTHQQMAAQTWHATAQPMHVQTMANLDNAPVSWPHMQSSGVQLPNYQSVPIASEQPATNWQLPQPTLTMVQSWQTTPAVTPAAVSVATNWAAPASSTWSQNYTPMSEIWQKVESANLPADTPADQNTIKEPEPEKTNCDWQYVDGQWINQNSSSSTQEQTAETQAPPQTGFFTGHSQQVEEDGHFAQEGEGLPTSQPLIIVTAAEDRMTSSWHDQMSGSGLWQTTDSVTSWNESTNDTAKSNDSNQWPVNAHGLPPAADVSAQDVLTNEKDNKQWEMFSESANEHLSTKCPDNAETKINSDGLTNLTNLPANDNSYPTWPVTSIPAAEVYCSSDAASHASTSSLETDGEPYLGGSMKELLPLK